MGNQGKNYSEWVSKMRFFDEVSLLHNSQYYVSTRTDLITWLFCTNDDLNGGENDNELDDDDDDEI